MRVLTSGASLLRISVEYPIDADDDQAPRAAVEHGSLVGAGPGPSGP
ncbi:hypothetical protein P9869_34315 [Streptomyces ossamyceticus]|nr:hypothetical protein [Streptomyces ossamyceticus]